METYIVVGLVLFLLLVLMILKEKYDYKKRMRYLIEKANNSFGTFSDNKFSEDELANIKKLFYRYQKDSYIDDITASDLDIDEIFQRFNNCLSAPGREYFYYLLRSPEYNNDNLQLLERKISFFENNENERNNLRACFLAIGNMRKANFFECLDYFDTVKPRKMTKEYAMIILLALSVGLIFVNAPAGIVMLVAVMCFNIVNYYKVRGEIESYIICFSYISNFLKNSKEIVGYSCEPVSEETERISFLSKELSAFERFSSIVTGKTTLYTGAGNPLDIIVDYLRMILHIDIIKFYKMLDVVQKKREALEEIYIILGKIETYINIASIRKSVEKYCIPESGNKLDCTNIYHPLVKNPVKNSICTDKGILITGSNASGKSTFLKAVAINSIFARTIHTCLADSFIMDNYYIFSSMALKDDIVHADSYFMVEIKALKRIFDYVDANPDRKVLCFVDEVLRGTNTIERIAAVTQILKSLNRKNVICFAATHDIELTEILDGEYSNYHFDEEINDDDIIFNYLIKEGKATSKNAIKLLSIIGFSDDIVNDASEMAEKYINRGVWI